MALTPGTRLGPYEIESLLGAGGMGEVYRARDTRLGRDVALKISAERFTERFEREARTVAALNHPRICTLYDVGPNFLVMELVAGPTLAERISLGPLLLEEALPVARQIAEALDAAHAKGVNSGRKNCRARPPLHELAVETPAREAPRLARASALAARSAPLRSRFFVGTEPRAAASGRMKPSGQGPSITVLISLAALSGLSAPESSRLTWKRDACRPGKYPDG